MSSKSKVFQVLFGEPNIFSGLEGSFKDSQTVERRMRKASIFLLLLWTAGFVQATKASIDPGRAVKFYRSSRSFFPSGEMSRQVLEKNWIQDMAESSYLVQREKKRFWVKSSSVARDLHLSSQVVSNRNQKIYQVLDIQGGSLLAQGPQEEKSQWLPFSEVSPLPEDLGLAITLTNTPLFTKASWKSETALSLPPGSRLKIHSLNDVWAHVTFESVGRVSGYVDLTNVLTKFDFASFVALEQEQWIAVLHRDGSDLVTADRKKIPLNKVKALMTKPDLAISVVSDDSENLLLRQSLQLIRTDFQTWSLSRIPGHGEVFWRKRNSDPDNSKPHFSKGLSLDELLKRDLVSVAFHPKNPKMAIASAQGIFLTTDGLKWNQLSIFRNQNHPLLIDSEGAIYVGPQRSRDGGLSFSPFFRWESLTPLLETKQKSLVQQLKIRRLTSPRPGILRMELETNLGALALAARYSGTMIQKWDFD